MQPSSSSTGEQADICDIGSNFGAADIEQVFQDTERLVAALFSPERQQRWQRQIALQRSDLEFPVGTIEHYRQLLSQGHKSGGELLSDAKRAWMGKQISDQRECVRKGLAELLARMRYEAKEGAVRISLELPDDRGCQWNVLPVPNDRTIDEVLQARLAGLLRTFGWPDVGVKFVVTRDAGGVLLVALFDPEWQHVYVANKYLKSGHTLEGAGKIKKASHEEGDPAHVFFDSRTCREDYGFDRPDDPVFRAELRATIEEEWTLLVKRASMPQA
ncbi:MAG: hypothetical protein V1926_02925 [Candidatus Peregrinibacteria bacterium]